MDVMWCVLVWFEEVNLLLLWIFEVAGRGALGAPVCAVEF